MARSDDHMSMAQFELLRWVADGCAAGVYSGTAHRVSARALHNRGLVQVDGKGSTWTATVTAKGQQQLKEHAAWIEAQRNRERREEQDRAEREREARQQRERAVGLLEEVVAAGGRLELPLEVGSDVVVRGANCLALEGLLPQGQRLTCEPTRMDPSLGVTAYLEPDPKALTPLRKLEIPQQLRDPHPAVAAFRDSRARVSKAQIPRAARYLQAVVLAAKALGWKVSDHSRRAYGPRGSGRSDLSLRLPSREIEVVVRELDERGRGGNVFITDSDPYTRVERTRENKYFAASGRLCVTLTKAWEQHPILEQRDTAKAAIEDQLAALVRHLEIAEAEAAWKQQEEERRSKIREVRWEEVKQAAFIELTYERNAEHLRDQLTRRDAATSMRAYADEVNAQAARLGDDAAEAAREWADWIRRHADRTDPITGPLAVVRLTSCSHDELEPHMRGWSTHGPFRQPPERAF
ncbi:hypothetical protein D7D52_32380 [Nocardia yunnanensis]|uniref:PE-PGRS family protein n=1 Tax=Nocardia yunnanensis TaxID=2382165 RepID=A0A386ZKC6_9NOCA|nr:hypothetical protein [Nocardia yunnanensis]AYF77733.1 hypothetical protein D7D52_32380 [Nocardia yunnanensis]